jgi:hypothetical protein
MNSLREPIHEWAVILAGGDGLRLQELSYKVSGDCRPKQFCEFFGGKSLLAHTRDRLQPLFRDENTLFVLNHAHRMYYWSELADVPSTQKLVQPSSRGTAPAIALAVREIMGRDPDCTIALFPSDHHYRENSIFQATIDRALQLAKFCGDRVLIIGAPATYPEVEYGWIQPRPIVPQSPLNALQYVSRFWEKPNHEEARALQKRDVCGIPSSWLVLVTPSWGCLGRPFPTCLLRSATGFPHPISIGSIAKSNRLTSRKTSCQRLQSVSCVARWAFWLDGFWQPTKSQGRAPYFRCSLA